MRVSGRASTTASSRAPTPSMATSPVSRWLPSSHGSATVRRLPASAFGRSSATRNWCRVRPGGTFSTSRPSTTSAPSLGAPVKLVSVNPAGSRTVSVPVVPWTTVTSNSAVTRMSFSATVTSVFTSSSRRSARTGEALPASRDDQPMRDPPPGANVASTTRRPCARARPRHQRAIDRQIGSLARRVDGGADRPGAELRQLRRGAAWLVGDGARPFDLQREGPHRQHRVEHALLLQNRHTGSRAGGCARNRALSCACGSTRFLQQAGTDQRAARKQWHRRRSITEYLALQRDHAAQQLAIGAQRELGL